MRTPLAAFLLLATAMQPAAAALDGRYHFVEMRVPEGGTGIRTIGGSIEFDGAGGYRIVGKSANGNEAGVEFAINGGYAASTSGVAMDDPAVGGGRLTLQVAPDASVAIGSSAGSGDGYALFIAVRGGSGESAGNSALSGPYAGAYLTAAGGAAAGLATAFTELTADGAGSFTAARWNGHSAAIDDINRSERNATSSYTLRGDGSGTALFAAPSDFIAGDREIFVSEGGEFLLATSMGAGERDILFAVRKDPGAVAFQFRGTYRMAELLAENGFVYRPEEAVFTAALGLVVSDSQGSAVVSEQLYTRNRRMSLTTINRYSLGATGWFGPAPQFAVNNFALSASGRAFVGALIGTEGALSLGHGIFAGIRAEAGTGSGPMIDPLRVATLAAPDLPVTSVSAGSLICLQGSGLAASAARAPEGTLAEELADVHATLNGVRLPLLSVSAGRIDARIPESAAAGEASLIVEVNGRASNPVPIVVAPSSPALFASLPNGSGAAVAAHSDGSLVTRTHPAAAGETVVIYGTGLGAGSDVRVLFDGKAGAVLYAGPAPGYPGVEQINVTLPAITGGRASAMVALGTGDSFTDLADLPVTLE